MKRDAPSYHGYHFPPEIISHAVWLYHRFGVSVRDVEDLLAQRVITVSYEAIRLWCLTFGSAYARRLTRRQGNVKLTKSWSICPQDTGFDPVVNPPYWASETAISLNLTIPASRYISSRSP